MFFNCLMRLPKEEGTDSGKVVCKTERQIYDGTGTYFAVPRDSSSLPPHAFDGFDALEEVFIPGSINKLSSKIFAPCKNLKKIVWQVKSTSSRKKGAPWGAPKTCEVTFDVKAVPRKEEGTESSGGTLVSDDTIEPVEVPETTSTPTPKNYRDAMLKLLQEIREYSKVINYPSMIMIGNGGSSAYEEDDSHNWTQDKIVELGKVMDGCSIEDVWYGTNKKWQIADDTATPPEYTKDFLENAQRAKNVDVTPLIIDYASTPAKVDDFYQQCVSHDMIGYCSTYRSLCTIPTSMRMNDNKDAVYNFKDVKNFFALLNPNDEKYPQFSSKEDYLTKLSQSDADMIIIDIFYDDHVLKQEDIKRLKHKSNGKRRQVVAYCSLGEAEDYRPYWNPDWSVTMPNWIDKENPDWEGNYKVKYWTDEWKKILFGTRNSYIDTIMRLGFDGLFLDVIDAYEYFENNSK